MPVGFARRGPLYRFPVQAGYCCGLAAIFFFVGSQSLQNAVANGDTRTISFHHIHTNEDLTITYKVNGRYDEEALKKINWELRDWRRNEAVKMDPHLIDLVWDVYRETEATQPIWVVCGYRAPATNAMLRRRSSGVAQHSQHMLGKAMDFYIPGVALVKLREAGLRAQRGGVGFYPTSGSPFVHLDTGNVRHWPHMPDAQLAKVLAKGPLTQVASNDKPTTLAASSSPFSAFTTLLERIRGETPNRDPVAAAGESLPSAKPVVVASAVPLPHSRPGIAAATSKPAASFELASAESNPVELRPAQAASLFSERGLWDAMPTFAPTPTRAAASNAEASITEAIKTERPATPVRQASNITVAAVEPETTASLTPWPSEERKQVLASAGGLAYAPTVDETPRAPLSPMGKLANRPAAQPDTTVAVKRSGRKPTVVQSGAAAIGKVKPADDRLNDPWIRAMVVSPSAMTFMSTSLLGTPDYRSLGPYLQKPKSSVMMTFSEDPYLGLTVSRFSGSAVVFVSTVTYNMHTAALR